MLETFRLINGQSKKIQNEIHKLLSSHREAELGNDFSLWIKLWVITFLLSSSFQAELLHILCIWLSLLILNMFWWKHSLRKQTDTHFLLTGVSQSPGCWTFHLWRERSWKPWPEKMFPRSSEKKYAHKFELNWNFLLPKEFSTLRKAAVLVM